MNKNNLFLLVLLVIILCSLSALGEAAPAPPAKTGQSSCYDATGTRLSCAGTGQTGDTKAGVAWPDPRFTVNENGTVTDNLTGLIWLKNALCFTVAKNWVDSITTVNNLSDGQCGLSDGSRAGDWRLPNVLELRSLLNEEQIDNTDWLKSVGFTNVQSIMPFYWSSTTYPKDTTSAWILNMKDGSVRSFPELYVYDNFNVNVWAVRAGE